MEKTVYIRLRHRVQVYPDDCITVSMIAQIVAEEQLRDMIGELEVHQVQPSDKNIVVIDVMRVLSAVHKTDPDIDVQAVGPAQTIVEIVYQKKTYSPVLFALVWLLLFVGAALAIMNFHEDVSMQLVHKRLYTIITGETSEHPLLLQIPYSIGLGLGMILFFNHLFKKRINEEPSPLEVEMFNYQLDMDMYVSMKENKESTKKIDDN
ncbi:MULTISPECIES: stage V sporulation protein AA [Metabacillus]|uniref:Stage V sporulation protein AA n=1 Tax=Metabacillus hrfriensis TaxID=3048891 RepID=A0ACD4R7D4_9BACI|nr:MULTISPECIES: stage V sporulation protein AA [Metabacillus]UAL50891.1 stage V sporulation protein AA [Metabacillus dongyingensis]UOK56927.1 stage V sporulation protein AA [Bacillus sp. OVS6]USK27169.1 stage V sporulation protein AA [Bacillus sp. CMF21]WHZ56391.1 stage V sporulation protein AA [Metabacillus sp. CT-WN-B3]